MTIAVLVFPGTNCDGDCVSAVAQLRPEEDVVRVFYYEESLPAGTRVVLVPGGFAYGDYLRVGALAKTAPVMNAVSEFAQSGGRVVGICNGFQVLCDAGLLPGALMPHASGLFHCRPVLVDVVNTAGTILAPLANCRRLRWPLSNHGGRYYISEQGLAELESEGLIFLRYVSSSELETKELVSDEQQDDMSLCFEPSSSSVFEAHERAALTVGGVRNKEGNIFGLMPHPERAIDRYAGGLCEQAGVEFLQAVLAD